MTNKIRCTKCGSDDVEVKAFVKPNLNNHCSIQDFTDCLDNIDNCFCIKCGDNTRLKYFSDDPDVFEDQDLYELMTRKLAPSYILEQHDDDSVYECGHAEYLRVKTEVCLEYGFDEDSYTDCGDSPFDEYDDAIRHEVFSRIIDIDKHRE